MTALLLACALGAVSFSSEALDGFAVTLPNPFSGTAQCNWIACDINADGAQDWLTPHGVHVQENGRYPQSAFLPLQDASAPAQIDAWKNTVYVWGTDALHRYTYENKRFSVAEQALENPALQSRATVTKAHELVRFLYNIDSDDSPELVVITEAGARIFRELGGKYFEAGTLSILPAMSPLQIADVSLWPADARHIQIPQRYRFARVWLEEGAASVLTWAAVSNGQRQFSLKEWQISPQDSGKFAAKQTNTVRTPSLPETAMPCRLNNDGTLDFAGFELANTESTVMPQPLMRSWSTLDFGNTLTTRNSAATYRFRQHVHFVDFENNEKLDLITESPDLFQPGIRETLARFTVRKKVDHTIAVYLQGGGAFSSDAAITVTVPIEFDAAPLKATLDYESWLSGKRVNITGDFNGDGIRDLVVRSEMSRLSIYLAEGYRYPSKPSASLGIPADHEFAVFDVNGDQRSDIVISPPQTAESVSPPIVHYAGGTSP